MQSRYCLEFDCQQCQKPVRFQSKDLEKEHALITCTECQKKYLFEEPTLKRQLIKFEALCRQIHESEEILGDTAVGVDVGDKQVKIPYKLLLTRLTTHLELKIGNSKQHISFRVEPLSDQPGKVIQTKLHQKVGP